MYIGLSFEGVDLTNCVSVLISVAAFVFSILQFVANKENSKKAYTIQAFDVLEDQVFLKEGYEKIFDLNDTNKKIERKRTQYLSLIEHFSVGINTGIYDLKTLKRMGGKFFIAQYEKWELIIAQKNSGYDTKKYSEFKDVADKLRRLY